MRFSESHFPYGSFVKTTRVLLKTFKRKNSGTLGNYSRRLQDYSKISWSTFQPRDVSSTLEDFWVVELGEAQELPVKAIKTTRNYLLDYKALGGLSYGHPWAHYSSGYQDRLLGGPLGLLDLCCTAPDGIERKDYGGVALG
jgi:hypothetical protein